MEKLLTRRYDELEFLSLPKIAFPTHPASNFLQKIYVMTKNGRERGTEGEGDEENCFVESVPYDSCIWKHEIFFKCPSRDGELCRSQNEDLTGNK